MAAQRPKRLEDRARDCFVHHVLLHATPPGTTPFSPAQEGHYIDEVYDKFLLCSETCSPHLLPRRKELLDHLERVKAWWDGEEWLGCPNSQVVRAVRRGFGQVLAHEDTWCFYPVFKFVLQCLFSSEAGRLSDDSEVKIFLEVGRKQCPALCEVLTLLKPFGIEELSSVSMVFGDTKPLEIVIENSENLRNVHLRHNVSEGVLSCLRENGQRLETLIIEKCLGRLMVTVDCLYQTFFSGADRNDVLRFSNEGNYENVKVTFPKLKWVDLNLRVVNATVEYPEKRLECDIMNHYPSVKSVSCFFNRPYIPPVLSSENNIRLKFPIQSIHLMKVLPLLEYQHSIQAPHCNKEKCLDCVDVMGLFSNLKQITVDTYDCGDEWFHTTTQLMKKIKIDNFAFVFHNTKDVELIPSLFTTIGEFLNTIYLDFNAILDRHVIFSAIKMCSKLETLIINAHCFYPEERISSSKVSPNDNISSLRLLSYSGDVLELLPVTDILRACPKLKKLDLDLVKFSDCEWLKASVVLLKELHFLRLNFESHPYSDNFVNTYMVPVINQLPKLNCLMLNGIRIENYLELLSIYKTTSLEIVLRRKDFVTNGYKHSR